MPTSNEWKTVNRRTALNHAITRSEGRTAEDVVKEAEEFRKFLDGES